jgi:hypothetical protein
MKQSLVSYKYSLKAEEKKRNVQADYMNFTIRGTITIIEMGGKASSKFRNEPKNGTAQISQESVFYMTILWRL